MAKQPDLTRWEKFAIEYAADSKRNAAEAYKKAGYAVKTYGAATAGASRLLKKPYVQDKLKELNEKALEVVERPKIADIAEIQEYLTRVLRGEETEEEFLQVGLQVVPIQKRPAITTRIKAAVELCKMQGGYKLDIDINGKLPVVICGEDDLAE